METQGTTENKESIKLMKMSKGYNWEIKIHITDGLDGNAIKRLELINDQLVAAYGGLSP